MKARRQVGARYVARARGAFGFAGLAPKRGTRDSRGDVNESASNGGLLCALQAPIVRAQISRGLRLQPDSAVRIPPSVTFPSSAESP